MSNKKSNERVTSNSVIAAIIAKSGIVAEYTGVDERSNLTSITIEWDGAKGVPKIEVIKTQLLENFSDNARGPNIEFKDPHNQGRLSFVICGVDFDENASRQLVIDFVNQC